MDVFHCEWNLWKDSVDMVISLQILEKELSCNESCLTFFMVEMR